MSDAKVVAIASQKGGVGKTTLALNGSYALAQRGWRTLLIDSDPQGSIGFSIRGELAENAGLAEVLDGSAVLSQSIVRTRLANFHILPVGKIRPLKIMRWSVDLEDGRALGTLFNRLRSLYDLIIVDTPPAISGVAQGVLRQSDGVLIPLQAEPLAARSVQSLLEVIQDLREEGSAVALAGIVVTMLQTRQESSLGIAQESWRIFPEEVVFDASIPRDPEFLEASAAGVPVALLRRRPPAVAAVFDQIAAELEKRLELEADDGEGSISLLG